MLRKVNYKKINILVGENDSGRTEYLSKLNELSEEKGSQTNIKVCFNNIDVIARNKYWIEDFGYNQDIPQLYNKNKSASFIQLIRMLNHFEESQPYITIDEPELHFHPNNHPKLARLLMTKIQEMDKSLFIVTNSPFFIRSIQIMILKKEINKGDLGFYYFKKTNNMVEISELAITDEGQFLHDYPDNLFSVLYQLNYNYMNN